MGIREAEVVEVNRSKARQGLWDTGRILYLQIFGQKKLE